MNQKKHQIALEKLKNHGIKLFDTVQGFEEWMDTPNLLLENKKPSFFIISIEGIEFIQSRLTGMQFGDNI